MCNCFSEVISDFIMLPLFLLVNGCAVSAVVAFCLWILEKVIMREDKRDERNRL